MKAKLLSEVQGLDRIAAGILRREVEKMEANRRAARAARLAEKWGATFKVGRLVLREGGAR